MKKSIHALFTAKTVGYKDEESVFWLELRVSDKNDSGRMTACVYSINMKLTLRRSTAAFS